MRIVSTTKPHVTVVGNSTIELAHPVPRIPDSGDVIYSGEIKDRPGSKAPRISLNLAAMGCRVFLLTCVGMDSQGANILRDLKSGGVNTDFIERTEDAPTGITHAFTDPCDNIARIVTRGAGMEMTVEPLLASKAMLSSSQLMILLPDIPPDVFSFAIRAAHHFRVPVLVPASPPGSLDKNLIKDIDILLTNSDEAECLSKVRPVDIESSNEVLNYMLSSGAGAAVLYLGANGAAVSMETGKTHIVPAPKSEGIFRLDAENCFASAFALHLMKGRAMHEAATYACAASTASAIRGPNGGLPEKPEILRLLNINM
ncbi:MAG TPA: PfkB family carbohydrate kinase [bacterium]|nr:PfkB family carbohydrate kinase [bacterium]